MPLIDCLSIELEMLRTHGNPMDLATRAHWEATLSRLKSCPFFHYDSSCEEMYQILHRHLLFYAPTRVYGEPFAFVLMVLITNAWDYPKKRNDYRLEKEQFLRKLSETTAEKCLRNDRMIQRRGQPFAGSLRYSHPTTEMFAARNRLSQVVPLTFHYGLTKDDSSGSFRQSQYFDSVTVQVQENAIGCSPEALWEVAQKTVLEHLRTIPLAGAEGSLLVGQAYSVFCVQEAFLKQMAEIWDDFSEYTFPKVMERFESCSEPFTKALISYFDFLEYYRKRLRRRINSSEECVRLAKLCLSAPVEAQPEEEIPEEDLLPPLEATVLFANGTCVNIFQSDHPGLKTLEERAIRILRDRYSNTELFEHPPECWENGETSEYGESVHCLAPTSSFRFFFWSPGEDAPLSGDKDALRAHFAKDYEDLSIVCILGANP